MVLEELGLPYHPVYMDLRNGEQNERWFVEGINPNGRIPALVDHANGDFVLWCAACPVFLVGQTCR